MEQVIALALAITMGALTLNFLAKGTTKSFLYLIIAGVITVLATIAFKHW